MTMTASTLPSPTLTPTYHIVVRQEPQKARLCSFKEKGLAQALQNIFLIQTTVDRRPIDPPPILQLVFSSPTDDPTLLYNPYLFVYATLTDPKTESDLDFMNGNRTTAGQMVQSLHKLKDVDNKDGGFFVFADISVRLEGFYKLKFTLFEMKGSLVHRLSSVMSKTFQVYSPKSFPGMSESTFLTRSFSDQGVRVRIRKEARGADSSKRRFSTIGDKSRGIPSLQDPEAREASFGESARSESGPPEKRLLTLSGQSGALATSHSDSPVVLPPPESLLPRDFRADGRMSMQNLLLDPTPTKPPPGSPSISTYSTARVLPPPQSPMDSFNYYSFSHEMASHESASHTMSNLGGDSTVWTRPTPPTLPPLHSKDWPGDGFRTSPDRPYTIHSP
ncbi:velvet factor-domain-containing protein [Phycomyces nitens]|nr:velvet factor-domain-containing protein [Phycomyces nitens]